VVICGADRIPIFNRLREGKQVKGEALLFAFDLIELDGRDLRREANRGTQGGAGQAPTSNRGIR
jgi:ATP-dependent DNA ligase